MAAGRGETSRRGVSVQAPSDVDDEPLISFSQNAEDVRLFRVFRGVEDGFYVDIGAAHPSIGSVTRLFYDRGWSGINAEPSPYFDELARARSRDVNLRVAIGEPEGPTPFFVTYPDPGMATLHPESHAHVPERVERVEEIVVQRERLETVLRTHASARTIHFLKVDVEGAEREVLASSDWTTFRPIVVVVEAIATWSTEPAHEGWEPTLLEAGYELATFDGINRFYVDRAHRDLAPALAYPISALDTFVKASEHEAVRRIAALDRRIHALRAERAEARTARMEAERRISELEAEREHLQQSLAAATETAAKEHRERVALVAEIDRLRPYEDAVASILRSHTWRAGRAVAALASPLRVVARRTRVRPEEVRQKPPLRVVPATKAYALATQEGSPWHFASRRPLGRSKRQASPLDRLIDAFGEPRVPLDAPRAARIAEELTRLGWTDDDSLLSNRLSWSERQAVVEADAVLRLVAGSECLPCTGDRVVVVDARCLQDPRYRSRGVGLHALLVLRAARAAALGRLVLLTSVELPPLDESHAALADEIVTTPYPLREADVRLFLELSPMTASAATAVPFLASPQCRTASVVLDFIPTEFPSAYLTTATSALENRVRLEALRGYDLLLPISAATEAAAGRLFETTPASTTGVGDPLDDVSPVPAQTAGPFVLVPAGGDPRKNPAASIAAVARCRQRSGEPLRAVLTGALSVSESAELSDLARRLGLPEDAVELRGEVDQSELAGLYDAAEATCVASFAEGFSIPVAESIRRGTPVVASDIPVHRELTGVGPWLADPADVEGLATALVVVGGERDRIAAAQRAALGDAADPAAVTERAVSALRGLCDREASDGRARPASRARARIAVVTPFPPQRSGVADYSAFTFRQVAKHADVEVFTAASPEHAEELTVRRLSAEPYVAKRFDAVVNVVGNSHFHFPMLDLMAAYGGACIAHDGRMVEAYLLDRGEEWTARFVAPDTSHVPSTFMVELLANLDNLPSIGYGIVARQASPLIVHAHELAERIFLETAVRPAVVPFVPYNLPRDPITSSARSAARSSLGFDDDAVHLGTFGMVDRRTKGVDLVVGAASWLHGWNVPLHLHIVGEGLQSELDALAALSAELGVDGCVTFHGYVPRPELETFLVAVDVAVQLRTSRIPSISGALADCIAFGVPTVTTHELARELDVPSYVSATTATTSSFVVAESIDALRRRRGEGLADIERERVEYLSARSAGAYAQSLLAALGLAE